MQMKYFIPGLSNFLRIPCQVPINNFVSAKKNKSIVYQFGQHKMVKCDDNDMSSVYRIIYDESPNICIILHDNKNHFE